MSMSASPAVRAIFFDAGNTLLRMDYLAITTALTAHGVHATDEGLQCAEWRARVRLDQELFAPAQTSTESATSADRYVSLMLEELGVDDGEVARAMSAWRRTYNPPVGVWGCPDPDAGAALMLARSAALTTGVISNSNGAIRSILDGLGLTRHLDFVLDSYEVGMEKPDPRIFRLALERAGVRADEAVYVGDLYSVDVLGARAAGLSAVLLDPGGCWGARDCPVARTVLDAVKLIVPRRVASRGPSARQPAAPTPPAT